MKKIVSNALIVSTQLIVGSLFLFMLFSDSNNDSQIVVIENNNLNKMADAVSELFEVNQATELVVDVNKVEALYDAEELRMMEEAAAKAEAERLAREEEARKAKEEEARKAIIISAEGYTAKPGLGFNVTTGNKTYELTEEEFAILATVVNCEAKRSSKDDILAVMSVILNRADSNRYPNDPVSVVAAPYQFSCYKGTINNNVSESVKSVMKDALNGIRNHNYYGFRSWQTSSYSDKYIVDGGNRYA